MMEMPKEPKYLNLNEFMLDPNIPLVEDLAYPK